MSRVGNPPRDTWLTANLPDVGQLVGAAEIQQLLGVGRQRAYQLTQMPDFPEPAARLKMGAVWRTAEVIAWAEGRGREIRESGSDG